MGHGEDRNDRHPGAPRARPAGSRHLDLAERITEDALQLLFTARQDIAEGPSDPILQRAQFRVLDAIEVLRGVASDLRGDTTVARGAPLTPSEFERRREAHAVRQEQWRQQRADWLRRHTRPAG